MFLTLNNNFIMGFMPQNTSYQFAYPWKSHICYHVFTLNFRFHIYQLWVWISTLKLNLLCHVSKLCHVMSSYWLCDFPHLSWISFVMFLTLNKNFIMGFTPQNTSYLCTYPWKSHALTSLLNNIHWVLF